MKQLLLTAVLAAASFSAAAQVTNYALEFDTNGTVDCGALPELDSRGQYLLQFWINPAEWTDGATVLSRGDGFKVAMGQNGTLQFTIGQRQLEADGVPVGEWSLVSLRRSEAGNLFVNGHRKNGSDAAIPADPEAHLMLGGGFKGRLDEVRIWGKDISDEFNYFEHTTLNKWNPNWDDLLVYYKMDQEQCDHLVDYKGIYTPEALWNHHGIISAEGVRRVEAENPLLPYLINSAYTANERFYDRSIPRDQYLLANDLIILGIESMPSGHLRTCTPNNHAKINGATRLEEFEGRKGVMQFDGRSTLDLGTDVMRPDAPSYTFEAWIYVDKWVPDAYIVRKETADGSKGFSIRLGAEDNHEIIVRVDGKNFYNQRMMKSGEWVHLAIMPNGGTTPDQTFCWIYNGTRVGYGSSKCDESTQARPDANEDVSAIIGEGFIGKIDELAFWDRAFDRGVFKRHMEGLPMPGINKSEVADILQRANTYLRFDDAANPGWSSHSQDEWKRIMESAYEGHRGYKVRISVKSHNNWQSTITSAEKRRIFAADLAKIAENYDGVELDLEWIYGPQTSLGSLAKEIRQALPEGKILMVSCHNVAYQFPSDKFEYCDGFTFQQYGPQKDHSYYSHFVNMNKAFVNYGFPKEKILCSYATTTSRGYRNGSMGSDIKGVKDGFMEEGFEPSEEVDYGTHGGETFYFDGPLQTYKRALYVTENRLGGIFYWDMGNDTRPHHRYNLAKWCSWGLNHNVDTLVTNVDIRHYDHASVSPVTADRGNTTKVSCSTDGRTLKVDCGCACEAVMVSIFDLDGRTVARRYLTDGKADIADLRRGHYIMRVTHADGRSDSARFSKQR